MDKIFLLMLMISFSYKERISSFSQWPWWCSGRRWPSWRRTPIWCFQRVFVSARVTLSISSPCSWTSTTPSSWWSSSPTLPCASCSTTRPLLPTWRCPNPARHWRMSPYSRGISICVKRYHFLCVNLHHSVHYLYPELSLYSPSGKYYSAHYLCQQESLCLLFGTLQFMMQPPCCAPEVVWTNLIVDLWPHVFFSSLQGSGREGEERALSDNVPSDAGRAPGRTHGLHAVDAVC